MAKFRPYSREVLRRLRREWFRPRRGFFIGAALAAAVILAALTAWTALIAADSRFAWFVLGATYAGVVAVYLHGLRTAFLLGVQDGIHQLRGAYGEENTRDELKTAKRHRLIWCWVDSIGLQRGDLDHVVVTRRGGVLVIDSKWRNQVRPGDTQAMAADARRVKLRAEAVTRSLLQGERARHRARVDSVRVRPVVVLWGAEQQRLPSGLAEVEGIDFVAGRHLRAWLRNLEGDVVSKAAAAQLEALLLEFRETSAARSHPTNATVRPTGHRAG